MTAAPVRVVGAVSVAQKCRLRAMLPILTQTSESF